jgi:hypothetical protein
MYRSVRRRLLRALQPYQPNRSFWQATAIVLLPATYTAAEPRWSPGPEFVELDTASKWGRRTPDGRLHAVVRSTDRHTSQPVLISGALSAADLLGFGGITDKPHRLRWMAEPGTLAELRLTDAHPAMLYERWTASLAEAAEHRLALSGIPEECCAGAELTRRPDGRYQLVLALSAWSSYFAGDVDDISRALTSITRSYGPGTRLKLYRPDVDTAVTDPLYAEAWRSLDPTPSEITGVGTFVDRLTDLVQRASAAGHATP